MSFLFLIIFFVVGGLGMDGDGWVFIFLWVDLGFYVVVVLFGVNKLLVDFVFVELIVGVEWYDGEFLCE